MNRLLEGSEAAIVKYLRHVLHNGSFHPLTTFFLITCAVIGFTSMDRLTHIHAVVLEALAAIVLLYFADRRDQKIANATFEKQLEAVRALVVTVSSDATERSDNQERSMHAQDISIAHLTDHTDKDT